MKRLFKLRTGNTCLYGNRLVGFVEADDFIEAFAHVERHAAFDRFHAAGNRAAAAVDIQRDFVLDRVRDQLFHLFRRVGVNDYVRQVFNLFVAKTQKVIAPCSRRQRPNAGNLRS